MLSVCIIGSQARSSFDDLSDRDVLIVGDDDRSLSEVAKRWAASDWNVTQFHHPAFARMAQVNSLFVQHAKQEGKIVQDDGKFLSTLFSDFVPKSDYTAECNDSLKQIIELAQPNGHYWHDLCIADICYVLIRNSAILRRASSGSYCFQYSDLVSWLVEYLSLNETEAAHIGSLRSFKHGYRHRSLGIDTTDAIYAAAAVAKSMLKSSINSSYSSILNSNTTDEYIQLRKLELELIMEFEPSTLDQLPLGHHLRPLWQRIIHAAGYPKQKVLCH